MLLDYYRGRSGHVWIVALVFGDRRDRHGSRRAGGCYLDTAAIAASASPPGPGVSKGHAVRKVRNSAHGILREFCALLLAISVAPLTWTLSVMGWPAATGFGFAVMVALQPAIPASVAITSNRAMIFVAGWRCMLLLLFC